MGGKVMFQTKLATSNKKQLPGHIQSQGEKGGGRKNSLETAIDRYNAAVDQPINKNLLETLHLSENQAG